MGTVRKPYILLVEDRPDGMLALEAALRSSKYDLLKASSGQEALLHLAEKSSEDVAVIILDVQMPVMDGFETANGIKRNPSLAPIPIIFVTAIHKDLRYVYEGYRAGAVDYLFKPFDPDILRSKVSVFVDLFEKNRQLRNQAEELRRAEQRNRLLIESARDIIATTALDGTLTSLNPAFEATTGARIQDWVGRHIEELVHADDKSAIKLLYTASAFQDAPLVQARLATATGKYLSSEFSGKPLIQGGKVIGMLAVVRDISARVEAEDERRRSYELERTNRELQQFASICSHDLQEPLRIVSNYAQLLDRKFGERMDSPAKELITFIVSGTTRMSQLIKDLLSYSRLGESGVAFEPTSIESVVKNSVNNLQASISETGATVVYRDLPMLVGIPSQLTQLFQNLIGNAIKFRRDEHPEIRISARPSDGGWQFSVSDNGIGFEQEYGERIFEIFKRLHGPQSYPGTGIGLAICKKIVERHGGRIWAESKLGEGSTFHFVLSGRVYEEEEDLSVDFAQTQVPAALHALHSL